MSGNRFRPIIAATQEYFQKNRITIPNLIPIPITTNATNGWGFSTSKPSIGLRQIVESIVRKKVIVREFDAKVAPNVDGMMIEGNDESVIFVNRGLNFCWRRFFVAKELTHLLMNHGDSTCRAQSSQNVKEVIQDFFNGMLFGSSAQHRNTEHEAMFIAVELFYPKQIKNLVYDPPLLPMAVAEKIKVPEAVIAARHSFRVDNYFDTNIYSSDWYSSAIIAERVARAN